MAVFLLGSGEGLDLSLSFFLTAGGGRAGRGKGTKSFLLTIFSFLKAKRDEWVPRASAAKRATLKPHTV